MGCRQSLFSSELLWNVDFAVWFSSTAIPWMPTKWRALCQSRGIKDERYTHSLPSDHLQWGKSFQVLDLLEVCLECWWCRGAATKAAWLELRLGGWVGVGGKDRSKGVQGTGGKSVKKAKGEKQHLSLENYR